MKYQETLSQIAKCKKIFENELEKRLNIIKVPNPLFVRSDSGLQDNLSGSEKAVSFYKNDERFEVVHSLAKWKRVALGKYGFKMHTGLYVNMKAIRKEETVDELHSLYVEQWDFEKVIDKKDRNIDYLKKTANDVYKAFRATAKKLNNKTLDLPEELYFIDSQELEDLYPKYNSKKREDLITREKKAVFVIGIGDKLKSGKAHDLRSPDYDDWKMNGDILIFDPTLNETVEISSMGIRVDENSIKEQLKKARQLHKLDLPYHKQIINKQLPYSVGGGIGESRVYLLLLNKDHIAEVQASSWENKTYKKLKNKEIL